MSNFERIRKVPANREERPATDPELLPEVAPHVIKNILDKDVPFSHTAKFVDGETLEEHVDADIPTHIEGAFQPVRDETQYLSDKQELEEKLNLLREHEEE